MDCLDSIADSIKESDYSDFLDEERSDLRVTCDSI